MPFSQIIPPSPSPTESKRLFYTSVSQLKRPFLMQGQFKNFYTQVTVMSSTVCLTLSLGFPYALMHKIVPTVMK